jgi:hypothetical protein
MLPTRVQCRPAASAISRQVNPHSEAPALEHAYAVTTYSAQGTTVDRAFVMADPSMDKQELYVAASRSREETYIYATPEIQSHREEIAPEPPYPREGIPHIAEAAERDRAQRAAHDVARLEALPTEDLVSRQAELRPAAEHEAVRQERWDALKTRIERGYEGLESYRARREEIEALPRRERKEHLGELARVDSMESLARKQLSRLEVEMETTPLPKDAARRELALADRVLAERRELAIAAARIAPPAYIRRELGERPSDPTKRKAWDRAVSDIEGFRQKHGITDPRRALGREHQRERTLATQRLHDAQRVLGLGQHASRKRDLGRSLRLGR